MAVLLGQEEGGWHAAVLGWWGGGGASMAVKDVGGSGCAVALLGQQWHYRGMRAVVGVTQWEREVTINMLLGGACGKVRGLKGARRSSWLPGVETTSLAQAEAPRRHSLQGWRLSCGGKEEVVATKAMKMAVGMLSSWHL
jgi:hypothetical protein